MLLGSIYSVVFIYFDLLFWWLYLFVRIVCFCGCVFELFILFFGYFDLLEWLFVGSVGDICFCFIYIWFVSDLFVLVLLLVLVVA